MINMFRIVLALMILPASVPGYSQLHSESRKAVAYYNQAMQSYRFLDYKKAEQELELTLKADPEFIEAYLLRAEMSSDMKKFDIAIRAYRKVIEIDPDFYKNAFYNLGHLEMLRGEYRYALDHLQAFLSLEGTSEKLIPKADKDIANCSFALEAMEKPVDFNPIRMGDEINSKYDDYWPSVTADDKTMVFTRLDLLDPKMPPEGAKNENFYLSDKQDGIWTEAQKLGPPVNTIRNEGAQSLTADGNFMYFTACNREDGLGSCDLYVSSRLKGKWLPPSNLGSPVNSKGWDTQPSIAPDGRTLYFTSNRPGGKGKMDIWYSTLSDEGKWSEPVNLGDSINTADNEMSPYIHKDNRRLYFSSDGWTGMGGFDLFVSVMKADSSWQKPQNMGYPINTWSDEVGLVLTARGDVGYFSSAKEEETGRDIYYFELPVEMKPEPVSYIEGKVFDKLSEKALIARIELIDLENSRNILRAFSDYKGSFLVSLPANKNYALNASRAGYLFYSANFSFKGDFSIDEPRQLDIPLSPLLKGERTALRNIFFDYDSYELLDESMVELDKLVQFLKDNDQIKVLIEGHTDSRGEPAYNLSLSAKRARAVRGYLLDNNISLSRLSYIGYGESRPLAGNETAEGRALNRRIEIVIVE